MVLKDYPDAKRILNARARKLMKENEERLAKEMSEHRRMNQKVLDDLRNPDLASSDQVSKACNLSEITRISNKYDK